MISIRLALLMPSGSSAGLFVSTTTTVSPSPTSSRSSGRSRSQRPSTKDASVFGSPSSLGSASWPRHSRRYHAQMIGDPVESVSGEKWPKTLIVMCGHPEKTSFGGLIPTGCAMSPCGEGGYLTRGARALRPTAWRRPSLMRWRASGILGQKPKRRAGARDGALSAHQGFPRGPPPNPAACPGHPHSRGDAGSATHNGDESACIALAPALPNLY